MADDERSVRCWECGAELPGPNVLHTWEACEIVKLRAEVRRLRTALFEIAGQDFRGNEPVEHRIARTALNEVA